MICLAIHYGHNATAALSINSEIITIISEERITRIKNYTGFPVESLRFIKSKYLDNTFENVSKFIFIDEFGHTLSYLKKRKFTVNGYDPFFKNDLIEKYAIENNLEKIEFNVINTIDDEILKNIDCMCIVQHHDQDKDRFQEIYQNSLVPFIYDCQNKISQNSKSKTILNYLGG